VRRRWRRIGVPEFVHDAYAGRDRYAGLVGVGKRAAFRYRDDHGIVFAEFADGDGRVPFVFDVERVACDDLLDESAGIGADDSEHGT
jgi:hypothetical protein